MVGWQELRGELIPLEDLRHELKMSMCYSKRYLAFKSWTRGR